MKFLKDPLKVQSKNVQHGFQPVYYYSRVAGLWPFTITYNSHGSIKEARIHPFDILWLCASICLYSAAIFYYIDIMMHADPTNGTYISNMISNVCQTIYLVFCTVGIAIDMFNRKNLVSMLDKFTVFDTEVSIKCVLEK